MPFNVGRFGSRVRTPWFAFAAGAGAAKAKAETLLQSIGAEIGKPLMVRDFDFPQPYMEMNANVRMMKMESDQSVAEEPIAFRKIKMQAQITAQFEIK